MKWGLKDVRVYWVEMHEKNIPDRGIAKKKVGGGAWSKDKFWEFCVVQVLLWHKVLGVT